MGLSTHFVLVNLVFMGIAMSEDEINFLLAAFRYLPQEKSTEALTALRRPAVDTTISHKRGQQFNNLLKRLSSNGVHELTLVRTEVSGL